MADQVGEVFVRVSIDDSQFKSSINNLQKTAEQASKKMGDSFKNVGKSMTDVGKGLTVGVSIPLAAIGGIATKAAIDFESAFAGVRKTVDATDEQLAVLEQGIRDMAKEVPASAEAIAGVAEAAGQLGIQTDAILGFTRTMIDLGEATNLTAEEAATQLARLANIMGTSQQDFDRLGSTIVALGNNMATTEAEIVEMSMRLAGAGAQIGMSESDVLALSAALSSVGINAEAGGSAFSRVMLQMQMDVQSGGDALQQWADVAGMTVESFAVLFEQDATAAIEAFIQGLAEMSENGENVAAKLDEMGLSEIRVRDALLRAAGASDLFSEAINIGSQAWEENTALANEAAQRYATTESQLAILKNRLTDTAITLGETLAPALLDMLDAFEPVIGMIESAVKWFTELDPKAQQAIMTIAGIGVAAGPALTFFGQLTKGIGGLINTFSSVGKIFTSVGGTLAKGVSAAGPWGLAIAGIAAGATLIITHWDQISSFFKNLWDNVTDIFSKAWENISGFFSNAWDSVKSGVQNFTSNVTNAFSNAWENIKTGTANLWDNLKNAFDTGWDKVKGGVKTFTDNIGSAFSNAWDSIKNGASNMWDKITGVFKKGSKDVEKASQEMADGIVEPVQEASDEIVGHSIIPEMVQMIGYWLDRGAAEGETAFEKLSTFGIKSLNDLREIGATSIEALAVIGITNLEDLQEFGLASIEGLTALGIEGFTNLSSFGVFMFDTLKQAGVTDLQSLSTILQQETQRWQGFVNGVTNGIQRQFETTFSNILQGQGTFSENFIGLMEGIGLVIQDQLVSVVAQAATQSLIQFAQWAAGVIAKTAPAIVALMQQFYATLLAFYAWSGPMAPVLAAGTIAAGVAALGALVSQVMGQIVGLAEGGIVTSPTIALIGEAGPEAVIPLNQMNEGGGDIIIQGPLVNVNATVRNDDDINKLSQRIARENEKVLRGLGRRYA